MMKLTIKLLAILATAFSIVPVAAVAQEKVAKEYDFVSKDKNTYVGASVGWVAKDWITLRNGRSLHEDLWGNPDKMMNGFQF